MGIRQPEPHTKQTLTTIRPGSGRTLIDARELWAYRELLYFLMQRDIKVRYRQTLLGGTWAVIQPLSLAVVFSVVFGTLADVRTEGIPYPLFAFAALVPWTLFSQSLGASASSLVGSSNLVSKVYFPRLIVPLASAASFVLDFAIGLGVLAIMMAYYKVAPSLALAYFPLFAVLALASSFAVGIWLSALNVRYRDVRYAVPFLLQLLLFASPVGYSAADFGGVARIFYALNPMTGIAEGFRWALLGISPPPAIYLIVPTLGTTIVLLGGLLYFRRTERTFADLI